ncbi:MAG: hypothetical protein JWP34_494 [Massilia sp.]|nr:hypothetical protein [Massilia sp.]
MGLLKRIFERRRKIGQVDVERRAAAVIDHVIFDVGVATLMTGTFLMDKRFRLHFVGASLARRRGVIAAVEVGQVAEAAVFRKIDREGAPDSGTMKIHTACLAQALVRELGSQSPALRALPARASL